MPSNRPIGNPNCSRTVAYAPVTRVDISATGASYDLLLRYREELRYMFIVSQVEVTRSDEGADGFVVKVLPAAGEKCERCWNYSTHVGESARYPNVCERCVAALNEIESEQGE